jgi:hypothetical protein
MIHVRGLHSPVTTSFAEFKAMLILQRAMKHI